MKQEHFFGNAKWIGTQKRGRAAVDVVLGHFECDDAKAVELYVLGLGFFKCYINGKLIDPDTFLPLSSDYENSCDPEGEVLTGHRIYVPRFDITEYVHNGDNIIAVQYGGGWYTDGQRPFGLPKAIYRIVCHGKTSTAEFVSSEKCLARRGFVTDGDLRGRETQDMSLIDCCIGLELDDDGWERACVTEQLDTEYLTTDCPCDALIRMIQPRLIHDCGDRKLYDCGENTTGYPVLKTDADAGERVTVRFSERLKGDAALDPDRIHSQYFELISDGSGRTVQPELTWFGFRYFEIVGEASPECVKVVHADIQVSSSFECDNEVLNYAYNTFINTMLTNMHCGHPSDCPQIERRGYTGDGQLTCNAALSVFDARSFYEKWLRDIADCQDKLTGHVQYTAPYQYCGGGPGGWGSAIVEVPYRLYKHYGDRSVLEDNYEGMKRYIDYLEAHSEFGLVVSDKEGAWCLGDWCSPPIAYEETDIKLMPFHPQQIIIPSSYVNTYFMVRSLERIAQIANILGKDEDIPALRAKADERRRAIKAAFSNNCDGNYFMNIQGSNAFAIDLGIGIENLAGEKRDSYQNLTEHYAKLGYFDTGIFATDVLIRVLFEHGDGALAVKLLSNTSGNGYGRWREHGATTFTEYWDDAESRSQNHPMFGAPVAYFFEYLLGIMQEEDSAGYDRVCISPAAVECFGRMSGSINTPHGKIKVAYEKNDEGISFCICVPNGVAARFKYADRERALSAGENRFTV